MLKAIKIRLYPNKEQEIYINKLLGSYRFVYNQCLSLKKEKYLQDKTNLGLKELGNYFHNNLTKNDEFIWLKEHNTKVLKQSIMNLMEAYKRFFLNGNGFPKFKSKHDNTQSCRFPLEAISKRNDYLTNRLTLTSELKNIKIKTSDKYHNYLNKYKDGIKSATLSKTKTNKYFLSILVDSNEVIENKKLNGIIGIDLGIKDFIVTSKGDKFENLKLTRKNEKTLVKLNRQLSKKQKGSNNRNKARLRLAKFHEKLNNKKENYLHYVVNSLLNDNQVIVMEDLNVSGMLKNHNLSLSIQEVSFYNFKSILKYKSEWKDKLLIEIDRFYPSSKLCSCCGYKYKELSLKERSWKCPKCKTEHDRDYNAAVNILNEGKRIIGNRFPELTLVDLPLMDDPTRNSLLKSNVRVKQENDDLYNFVQV